MSENKSIAFREISDFRLKKVEPARTYQLIETREEPMEEWPAGSWPTSEDDEDVEDFRRKLGLEAV